MQKVGAFLSHGCTQNLFAVTRQKCSPLAQSPDTPLILTLFIILLFTLPLLVFQAIEVNIIIQRPG